MIISGNGKIKRVLKPVLLLFVICILTQPVFAQPEFSRTSARPGAFSRMGFGPRGIAMGNALTAVTTGNIVSYYNPAVSVFQEDNSFSSSYSFLGLDRSLNFISFTRRFDFFSDTDSTHSESKPRSTAGISAGIINAGVGSIDERDNQGFKTGDLTTSENQFFVAVANRFSEKFALGIAVKFYYYSLYKDITANGLGFDIGAVYFIQPHFSVSFVISDLNAKYKWDTSSLYGAEGASTVDAFPVAKKIGAAYTIQKFGLLLAGEFSFNNYDSKMLRFGAEWNAIDQLYFRAGIDNIELSNTDDSVRPSFGFSYSRLFGDISMGVEYGFMIEPYSSSDRHVVGISVTF